MPISILPDRPAVRYSYIVPLEDFCLFPSRILRLFPVILPLTAVKQDSTHANKAVKKDTLVKAFCPQLTLPLTAQCCSVTCSCKPLFILKFKSFLPYNMQKSRETRAQYVSKEKHLLRHILLINTQIENYWLLVAKNFMEMRPQPPGVVPSNNENISPALSVVSTERAQ